MTNTLSISGSAYTRPDLDAIYERHSAIAGHRLEMTVSARPGPMGTPAPLTVTTNDTDRAAVVALLAELEA